MLVYHGNLSSQGGGEEAYVFLACNDSTVKVIGDNGRLIYFVTLEAAVTSITLVSSPLTANQERESQAAAAGNEAFSETNTAAPTIILYGLQNGNFGALELLGDEAIVLWEFDCNSEENKAPISHIKVAQLKEN